MPIMHVLCFAFLGLLIVFQIESHDQDEYMLRMLLTFVRILDLDSRMKESFDD